MATAICISLFAGCGAVAAETELEEAPKRKIGIATYEMSNVAIYPLLQGMIDVVKEHGDEYVLVSAQSNTDTVGQIQVVEELVNRDDIDAIAVDSVNDTHFKDCVAKANEKGIPMAFNDIPFAAIDDDHWIVANVKVDNYKGAYDSASRMIEDFNGEAKILMLTLDVNQAVHPRSEAFRDIVKENPGIEVLAEENGEFEIAKATDQVSNLIMAHPDTEAILAIIDNYSIGASAALKAAGRTDIKIYSFDGSPDILPLIANGDVECSAWQNFEEMGRQTVQALYDYMDGTNTEINREIVVDPILFSKDNIEEIQEKFDNYSYDFVK